MFTGIVETTGEIVATEADADGRRVRVRADLADLHRGQSIAISGACLTVEDHDTGWFDLFLSQETVERTYLGDLGEGDLVNVERALPADGRLDGHVVQGHVDATAEVTGIARIGDDWEFRFSIPEGLERYVVEKGSVTVDGISLTVASLSSRSDDERASGEGGEPRADDFGVAIIPETYDVTTLSEKAVGDPVHIEVDVMAKYVESMLAGGGDSQSPYAERFE
ncbi:riboflavin synthase [Halorientalis marina]|jgi:riboflavin synthase|uniref:riboflavin synthase n=1 Tax=Halorientalis marina TaxID=2931976 RepID=UPI001FF25ABB|nr:riboflavin synthase [Halorientalis marina]